MPTLTMVGITNFRYSLKAALHFFNKGSDNLQMTPKWQSFDMQMSLKWQSFNLQISLK